MDRRMWKPLGIVAVALVVIGAGMVFTLSSQAATAVPAPGTICIKYATMGHIFTPVGTSNGLFAGTNGSITAQVGQPITTPDGRSGFQFAVVDFNSRGNVSGLGDVSFSLDTSRRPEPSTFIANSASGEGGNTQRIQTYLNVDINGRRYRSAGQVTLLSTAVQAFPPPSGTVYDLATEVQLVDSTGRVAFELPPGKAATIL
jgi:hypothetical protein